MNISISTLANLLPFLAILSQSVEASNSAVIHSTLPNMNVGTTAATGTSSLKDSSVEKHLDPVHQENIPPSNVAPLTTPPTPPTLSLTTPPKPPADIEGANKFYKDFYEQQVREAIVHPEANLNSGVSGKSIIQKAGVMATIKSMVPSFLKKKDSSAATATGTGTTTTTADDKTKPEGRIMPPTTGVPTTAATASLPHHEVREGEAVASGMGSYYEKFSKLLEIERLNNLSLTNSGKKPADIELSKLPPAVRLFVIANKIKHEIFEKVPCPSDDKDPLKGVCVEQKKFTEDLIEKVHTRFPFADDAYGAWIHTEPIPANGFLSGLFGHKKFLDRMENDQLHRINSIFQERNNALSAWDNSVAAGGKKKSEKVADEIKDLSSSVDIELGKLGQAIAENKDKSTWKESTSCLQAGYKAFKAAVTEFQDEATKLKELNAFTEATSSSALSKNGDAKKK